MNLNLGATMKEQTTIEKPRLEVTENGNEYRLDSVDAQGIGDYVFLIRTYSPVGVAQSATERLQEVIRPALIRTIAAKGADVLPSSGKCHAAGGARLGGGK
jgi:hypothetical protein